MRRIIILGTCLAFTLLAGRDGFAQDKITRSVSNDSIEKILSGLDVKFQKSERKDKDITTTFYEYTRNDQTCRLFNYGNDLWLECTVEKKLKPEDINRWNAEAKFSRLVLIESKDKTIVSLEAQLDCLGGVTDAAIRQYINRFDEEAKKFAKFVK